MTYFIFGLKIDLNLPGNNYQRKNNKIVKTYN